MGNGVHTSPATVASAASAAARQRPPHVHVARLRSRAPSPAAHHPRRPPRQVLDLDELGKAEGVSWVWGGSTVLDEGPGVKKERVLIRLSRGGSDATIARELDLNTKAFIPPAEGGFEVPEAKSRFCYKDRDTLLIGGVFGDGEMTDSGYPRSGWEWKRGTPLSAATKLFEGKKSDVAVDAYTYLDREVRYTIYRRAITFYTTEVSHKMPDGSFKVVPVQEDAEVDTFGDQLLITLRSDWLGFEAGSLLAAPALPFMQAADDGARTALLTALFVPTASASLEGRSETRNYLILTVLETVVAGEGRGGGEVGRWGGGEAAEGVVAAPLTVALAPPTDALAPLTAVASSQSCASGSTRRASGRCSTRTRVTGCRRSRRRG